MPLGFKEPVDGTKQAASGSGPESTAGRNKAMPLQLDSQVVPELIRKVRLAYVMLQISGCGCRDPKTALPTLRDMAIAHKAKQAA